MKIEKKIIDLNILSEKLDLLRLENKKIVLCHGCFDLLHIGHIRYFRQAKKHGDILVVTLTPDRFVDKGPSRPAFSEDLRAEAIASLDGVDFVAINEWPTAENTLRLLKPHYYAKGSEFKNDHSDYTGKIDRELTVVEEIGAEIVFTEDIVFSSTNLINRFLSDKTEETQEYFQLFRKRHNIEEIHEILDKMASLKILVIGDTILDDYHYCEAIGKSNKDPVLVLKYKSNDLFAGGVLAVANHLANFAEKVRLVTLNGEFDSHRDFIEEKLHHNISPHFAVHPKSSTLIKRRFLDGYTFSKLFEVYIMDGFGLPEELDLELCELVKKEINDYDLVVAADFGHGTISDRMIKTLCENAKYLAVNTQANAGNRGFHTISSYPRADFISLAEHEIRLEKRAMVGAVRPMMEELAVKLDCSTFVTTRGRKGCMVRGRDGNFVACPSLATNIVDRVGAGDAFFTIAAMAAYLGVDEELVGFLGNAVGSIAVEIIGNQKSIDIMGVKKYLNTILK
jgi:rfaE bifunctional protein nucleotidyltransferase chain/domain